MTGVGQCSAGESLGIIEGLRYRHFGACLLVCVSAVSAMFVSPHFPKGSDISFCRPDPKWT